jgi:acetyl esterase/lipase
MNRVGFIEFASPLRIARMLLPFIAAVALLPVDSRADEVEVREKIVYSKVGERELLLDAFLPGGEEQRPAILVVHGGAWRSGNRSQLRGYATTLTKMGFACFAIDYRLAPAHKFPAQIEDCRAAVIWIREHATEYSVDTSRLGAIGYSAGGHLVSLLATTGEAPSERNGNVDTRIHAVAAGGAPTDFRWFPDDGKWATYLMGGDLKSHPKVFLSASAAAFADKNDPPVFFFNGDEDKLVPLAWTKSCYEALKNSGVKTEMHIIKGAGHMQAAGDKEALQKAAEFLKQELLEKKEEPAPASE